MFQVKIFDRYSQDLEMEINRWLRCHKNSHLIDIKYLVNDEGDDFAMIIYKVSEETE